MYKKNVEFPRLKTAAFMWAWCFTQQLLRLPLVQSMNEKLKEKNSKNEWRSSNGKLQYTLKTCMCKSVSILFASWLRNFFPIFFARWNDYKFFHHSCEYLIWIHNRQVTIVLAKWSKKKNNNFRKKKYLRK